MKALLLVLAAASVALLAGCADDGEQTAPPPGRSLATSRALTPTAHLFGDFVQARLDVIVDRKDLDPDGVKASLDFLPLSDPEGGDALTRGLLALHAAALGGDAQVHHDRVRSRAGSRACSGRQEGRGERRTYSFKPTRITYEDPKTGKVSRLRQVFWPPLDAISRLSPEAQEIPSYGLGSAPAASSARHSRLSTSRVSARRRGSSAALSSSPRWRCSRCPRR